MENYGVEASDIATENISSTVSSEMRRDAVIAVIIATICMLLYIWFRFKDIRFATSAVIALMHDVLVVLGFYVICKSICRKYIYRMYADDCRIFYQRYDRYL